MPVYCSHRGRMMILTIIESIKVALSLVTSLSSSQLWLNATWRIGRRRFSKKSVTSRSKKSNKSKMIAAAAGRSSHRILSIAL